MKANTPAEVQALHSELERQRASKLDIIAPGWGIDFERAGAALALGSRRELVAVR